MTNREPTSVQVDRAIRRTAELRRLTLSLKAARSASPYGAREIDRCESDRWERMTPYECGVAAMEGGRALIQLVRLGGETDFPASRWKADLRRFEHRPLKGAALADDPSRPQDRADIEALKRRGRAR